MMEMFRVSPELHAIVVVGAFLSTPLMLAVGMTWGEWKHRTDWSLRWAYLAGFLLGCVVGVVWLATVGPFEGSDHNILHAIVAWWLGLCVLMLPISLVFTLGFIGVFAGFLLLMALVSLSIAYWFVALPVALVLLLGWGTVTAVWARARGAAT